MNTYVQSGYVNKQKWLSQPVRTLFGRKFNSKFPGQPEGKVLRSSRRKGRTHFRPKEMRMSANQGVLRRDDYLQKLCNPDIG